MAFQQAQVAAVLVDHREPRQQRPASGSSKALLSTSSAVSLPTLASLQELNVRVQGSMQDSSMANPASQWHAMARQKRKHPGPI